MRYPSHSALQPTPGNCTILASFILALVGTVRSNVPLQVVGLIVGFVIGYLDRNHTAPENRTWSARWKQLNRLLSRRRQSSESPPSSVELYTFSELTRPTYAVPGLFERITRRVHHARHITAAPSSANLSSPVFLLQNRARDDGGDDREQRSSSQKPASNRDDGISTRTPTPAVQSVVHRHHTSNSEDSTSYSRCNSSNTDTRLSRPVSPTVAASGLSVSRTTTQSDSSPSRPVSPTIGASPLDPADLTASPTTTQSDTSLSRPVSPTVTSSTLDPADVSASPTTTQSDITLSRPVSPTVASSPLDPAGLPASPTTVQSDDTGPSRPVSPTVAASDLSASPTTTQSDIRPSRPVSPTVTASPVDLVGLSVSPTTAQSDQSQDPPSSSTSQSLQDETLQDTVTVVQDPEAHRDVVEDSSHAAASGQWQCSSVKPTKTSVVHSNDTVLVDKRQATTHPGLRQRKRPAGVTLTPRFDGRYANGCVQRLNNYYQRHGVTPSLISYSHQAVPGIGYAATITLSNFQPSGQYIGTGAWIQAAKEAAAYHAMQALRVV